MVDWNTREREPCNATKSEPQYLKDFFCAQLGTGTSQSLEGVNLRGALGVSCVATLTVLSYHARL